MLGTGTRSHAFYESTYLYVYDGKPYESALGCGLHALFVQIWAIGKFRFMEV